MKRKGNHKCIVIAFPGQVKPDGPQPAGPTGNAVALSPCGTKLFRNRRRYARHYLLREMSLDEIRHNTGARLHEADFAIREAIIEIICDLRRNAA